jgi:hypothetical protein
VVPAPYQRRFRGRYQHERTGCPPWPGGAGQACTSATEVNLMTITITKVEKIEATRIHLTPGELA